MIEKAFFEENKSAFHLFRWWIPIIPNMKYLTDFHECSIEPDNYLDSEDDVKFRRNKNTLYRSDKEMIWKKKKKRRIRRKDVEKKEDKEEEGQICNDV